MLHVYIIIIIAPVKNQRARDPDNIINPSAPEFRRSRKLCESSNRDHDIFNEPGDPVKHRSNAGQESEEGRAVFS